jgi:hypothetical protein
MYNHGQRIPKLIMEWIPEERRKRGGLGKTWMEGVQAAMTARNLEQDQWRNREEWRKTATGVIKPDRESLSKVYMLRYVKVDRGSAVSKPLPYYSDNLIIGN